MKVESFLITKNIQFNLNVLLQVKSPPNSPDLNPIEWMWGDLKHFVSKKFCRDEFEVVEAIEEFKKTLTEDKCQKYIKKLKQVLIN